jgi:CspA family cold shock protein
MVTAQAVAASSKETGIVKVFHAARGFEFITREGSQEGDADLFVHFTAIQMDGYKELIEGNRVEFDVVTGRKNCKRSA